MCPGSKPAPISHQPGSGSPEEGVEVMDCSLGGEPGMGEDAKHVEMMALCAGREEEGTTGEGRRGKEKE